ncbi:protein N-terminal asparagine amidohydrolase-like [Amphibalanus amphitrite]|uniref:protein N-terminal asparagine amidohydrolase-like n=1 Tax=Amphibalanus amphitrite TaxID=1232801 RepID=UPI001C91DF86|nr:protein N-terminal asparagine amidohydrolase-like [Amphibalanus amphitrite]
MVLCIAGTPIDTIPQDLRTLFQLYPHLKEGARHLCSLPAKCVGPAGLLYVSQRELAVTVPHDRNASVLGTDDCTTCHMAVFRHTASGATSLTHLDSCEHEEPLQTILQRIAELSKGYPAGRVQLHLVGGYRDGRGVSEEVSLSLLNALSKTRYEVDLVTCCLGELNTITRDGMNWPVVYGVGVTVETGELFPASFPDKGPEMALRHARFYTGGHQQVLDIYDCQQGLMRIGPFNYEPLRSVDLWLRQSDEVLLKHLSTSPEVEPPHFATQARASLKYIQEHPFPASTIFPDGRPHYFRRDQLSSQWVQLSS